VVVTSGKDAERVGSFRVGENLDERNRDESQIVTVWAPASETFDRLEESGEFDAPENNDQQGHLPILMDFDGIYMAAILRAGLRLNIIGNGVWGACRTKRLTILY
jgi:hypothetical protein